MNKNAFFTIMSFCLVVTTLAFVSGCAEDGYRGDLKDKDGNVYKTLVIGEQVWMGENLKALHYHDESAIEGVMVYEDNESNASIYGRLYNYDAATKGGADKKGRIRGACPKGFHIPTDDEWKELERHLGMKQGELDNIAWRGTLEGGMLKETGTDHWVTPNTGATNSSGFTALPAGSYNPGLSYTSLGLACYFWSASIIDEYEAWARVLHHSNSQIGRYPSGKDLAFCIRCIKD